jgi:hypothetical protein
MRATFATSTAIGESRKTARKRRLANGCRVRRKTAASATPPAATKSAESQRAASREKPTSLKAKPVTAM